MAGLQDKTILAGTMIILIIGAAAIAPALLQSASAETGFTIVKKTAGIIMKFCTNEAFTLQDCNERYEGLGWTDRINVLIYAPGWNDDSDKIDVIGTPENPIKVYTGPQRVTEVDFSETGFDTGIFMGVVKMTGAPNYLVHDSFHTSISTHGVTGSTENGPPTHGGGHSGGHGGMTAPQHGGGHGMTAPDMTAPQHGGGHGMTAPDMTAPQHGGGHGMTAPDMTAPQHGGGHGMTAPDMTAPDMTAPQHDRGAEISSHDRAVLIATEPQDGRITVSWEPNEDTIIQKSATYEWEIGEVQFHKPVYDVNEKVTFFLRDKDLWIHHAEFHTNYVRVYSDTDLTGIHVGVQFTPFMEHATVQDGFSDRHLTEPAASSLTKYTEDGRWKVYFWWEPGGLLGVGQDYVINLMAHDGMTDVHEMGLTYTMEIYLNGELVETRVDRSFADGQGLEPIRFDERGSVRIVIKDIFDDASQQVNFSFQVAPEAVIKEVVPRHGSFEEGNVPDYLEGYDHPHHYNYLEGEFIMTTTDRSDSQDRLRVSDGDTIYIEYEDLTLPDPYTTADSLDIVARALVLDTGTSAGDDGSEIFVEIPS